MKRKVLSYHRGEHHAVWVATLDCFHSLDIEQAQPSCIEMMCSKCAALQFPEGLTESGRTAEFTAATVPTGLLNHHNTKAGTWGQLHVLDGCVSYHPDGSSARDIQAGEHANIPPALPHSIRPDDMARFYVAFYTRPAG